MMSDSLKVCKICKNKVDKYFMDKVTPNKIYYIDSLKKMSKKEEVFICDTCNS